MEDNLQVDPNLKATYGIHAQVWIRNALLVLTCACVLALRFHNAFEFPNFYAEDGKFFVIPLLKGSFWTLAFTPFNGNLIFGLVLISKLIVVFFNIFNLPFTSLPLLTALLSVLILAVIMSVPSLLLFRNYTYTTRLCIAVTLSLIPLGPFQYEVVGVIGNLKWAFLFLSFVLFVYRLRLEPDDPRNVIVDLIQVLCFYTLPSVIIVLFLNGLAELWNLRRGRKLTLQLVSFAFMIGICSFAFYVAVTGGHTIKGYLDSPYEWAKTVELFIGRMFLYPIVPFFYKYLNDVVCVLLCGLGIYYGYKADRPSRKILLLSTFVIFTTQLLFVYARPGISEFSNHYSSPNFSRFFYAQNPDLDFFGFSDSKKPEIHSDRLRLPMCHVYF